MRLLAVPLVLALASAGFAGPTVEHPEYGYSVVVPDGWKHRFEGDVLWFAAEGGYRVRIEAKDSSGAFGADDVAEWYRTDGRSFQSKAQDFKILRKPTPAEYFGKDHPSYLYAFGYEPGPGQAVGYVAVGDSKKAGNSLKLRVLAYGRSPVVRTERDTLEATLGSFRWPTAPGTDATSGTKPGPNVVAALDPNQAATTGLPTGSQGSSSSGVRTAGVTKPNSGRPAGAANYKPEGEFDRGSLQGGLGALANGGVRYLSAEESKILDGRWNGIGAERTTEQRETASQYLGFKKK